MDSMPIMNNPRLNKFSESYFSDQRERVEQRCFFLFGGQDIQNGNAFAVDIYVQKNDNPDVTKVV